MTGSIRDLSFAVALILLSAADTRLPAQGLSRSAEALYADASAEEAAVRKALAAPKPPPTVVKAVRTVVLDFEAVTRRYPDSPYADDALWRGALLSSDAFRIFGDPAERLSATRLLQMLTTQYPSSKLAKQSPALVAELSVLPARGSVMVERDTPGSATPAATAAAPPATVPVPVSQAEARTAPVREPAPKAVARPDAAAAPRPARGQVATIKDIRRVTLPDVVRVIIELDREVSFRDDRLANPSRVYLDLPGTAAAKELQDQTLRFDGDTDPVRQVRLGRHPNSTTRVVLEADAVSSYSVYSLYNPFRLVIDCLREPSPSTTPIARAAAVPPQLAVNRAKVADAAAARMVAPVPSPPPVVSALPPFPTAIKPIAPPPPIAARRIQTWARTTPNMGPRQGAALTEAREEYVPDAPAPLPVTPQTVAALPLAPAIEAPSRMLSGGFSLARQLGMGVSRIVIDPGHGGHDPGAKGGGVNEADLVLDIALRLEKLFQSSADTEVILTRRTDDYVTLQERTAIANREGADLFLSIHANASRAATARGVETYFLNFATNQSAAATAARENAASGQSMGELPDAVRAIALHNKLEESKDFATYVQREMVQRLGGPNQTRDLGVKQAPFQVLIGAAMPSILAEIAFLSNVQDARLVKQSSYRQKIAEALFNAVRKYQRSLAHVSTADAR